MNFRYVNSRGEILDFSEFPYLFQSGDLVNYSWKYDSTNNRITNVRRETGERPFKVGLIPDWSLPYAEKRAALKEAAEHLFNVIEYDVINNTDGRIETDTGSYFPCRILVSDKSDWEKPTAYMFHDLTAVSGKNAWISEQDFSFYPAVSESEHSAAEFLDYAFDYDFEYTPQQTGRGSLNISHLETSDFKLTIFGPCSNPRILIAGHPYEVFTSLQNGEYLVIDSRNNTVMKYLSNGTQESVYDLRGKVNTVFEKIPPGYSQVSWDGTFGFELTVFLERSEPLWI